jgi:hypothetical protein
VSADAGSGTPSAWTVSTTNLGLNLQVVQGGVVNNKLLTSFVGGIRGESAWDGVTVVGNQVYNYNVASLILTPTTTVAASGGVQTVAFSSYLADANTFMNYQSADWGALGANPNGATAANPAGAVIVNGANVLVNIRPGIAIKNSGGNITVEGDATNPDGIDLSGSAYVGPGGSGPTSTGVAGSVLNHGDTHTLNGHFGQYDEPIVLAIRAAGNLNFGICGVICSTVGGTPTLGSLSDGFSQFYNNGKAIVRLYTAGEVQGAGASGAATLFDPAAMGAYNALSGGLGADSASYFLTAGADTKAANPLAIVTSASAGTLTVAGVPPGSGLPGITGASATADPLFVYDDDTTGFGFNGVPATTLAQFVDYASLVRTGTGNIAIATSKDLILQSPLSLVYTAGTGYNVNGGVFTDPVSGLVSFQPLAGFTQYNGMLSIAGKSNNANNPQLDTLPASVFPTHGGDLTLAIGGNIVGAMNADVTPNLGNGGNLSIAAQMLSYDLSALGSQLKLQNWCTASTCAQTGGPVIGPLSALYATNSWINALALNNSTYTANIIPGVTGSTMFAATPGNYQLAWYTRFPFLENTIGSFGGGNISVKAGGSISLVQFVSPTNARDAGPALVSNSYALNANLLTNPTDVALNGVAPIVGGYSGLYVQGGGNISVTAGGNISGVYTYAQNGATTLRAGGSIGGLVQPGAVDPVTIPLTIETSTGYVSIEAGRSATLGSLSLIQNADSLMSIVPNSVTKDRTYQREITVLTGILTSVPTGSVTVQGVGGVAFGDNTFGGADVGSLIIPGGNNLVPPQLNLVSLQGDVTNNTPFVTYPAPSGNVNLLARGSVALNASFVVSDASPTVTPTLANFAAAFASPSLQTTVTGDNAAHTTLPLNDLPLVGPLESLVTNGNTELGSTTQPPTAFPNNAAPASVAELQGDAPAQLIVDLPAAPNYGTSTATPLKLDPQTENERHAGLHAGQSNPARIVALNGDVTPAAGPALNNTLVYSFGTSYESITRATEGFAGLDVVNLALLGQNNNATDITSIVAGRDVRYQNQISPSSSPSIAFAIEIGGPGNLLVQSGRNTDLGSSAGIQTFDDLLNPNPNFAKLGPGASITIQTGIGTANVLDAASFIAQFVNPATAAANPLAEPIQLVDAKGNVIASGDQAFTLLSNLSPQRQQILLDEIFLNLIRDSGREHTGAIQSAFLNYQRAFAAIAAYLPNSAAHGDFLGGLSTVRTQAGGDITVLAPHGQIEVGLVNPPTGFKGYSNPVDPTYALDFGIVTERGGNVDLYANGNISVNQSRVFTLEGGNLIAATLNGNIDAGKGAKTVQCAAGRAARQRRPDRHERVRRRRRRRHPFIGQSQHRGGARAQRRQHPGRRQGDGRAHGRGTEYRRSDGGEQRRRLRRQDRCSNRQRCEGPALGHHRRSAGIWRRRGGTIRSGTAAAEDRRQAKLQYE